MPAEDMKETARAAQRHLKPLRRPHQTTAPMHTITRADRAQADQRLEPPLRPGPQPFNRIAGTFSEQLARATKPRNPSADYLATRGQVRRVVSKRVRIVADELAVLVARVAVLEERLAAGGEE
jgi:hypothetical protein